jgi:hypothetical protein
MTNELRKVMNNAEVVGEFIKSMVKGWREGEMSEKEARGKIHIAAELLIENLEEYVVNFM